MIEKTNEATIRIEMTPAQAVFIDRFDRELAQLQNERSAAITAIVAQAHDPAALTDYNVSRRGAFLLFSPPPNAGTDQRTTDSQRGTP